MARKYASPILPSDLGDPTATDALVRSAEAEFRRRLREVLRVYTDKLDKVPRELVPNARYAFDLRPEMLAAIFADVDTLVDEIMLDGGEQDLWFFQGYVQPAYQRGTSRAVANLARQSPAYRAERGNARDVLRSEPYRNRLGLIRAREFEEMKSLTGQVKSDMSRLLTDGMARGKNPLAIAKNMTEQLGIEEFRANRIARTEITTALRRGRLDESDDAEETYALDMRQMHMSALSPTTRASHAQRHGNLYTTTQVRDWYSEDANSINCKCSQVEVLVDSEGNPLVPAIVTRAKTMRTKYEERMAKDE